MDALPAEVREVTASISSEFWRDQKPIRVVAQPSIFREPSKRIVRDFPHGATLLDFVLETGMGELRDGVVHLPGKVLVTTDGHQIDRDFWHCTKPSPGRLVNITLVPQDQRQAIVIGASLAIGVAAIGPGGAAAAVARRDREG
jgi:hypothetical protein